MTPFVSRTFASLSIFCMVIPLWIGSFIVFERDMRDHEAILRSNVLCAAVFTAAWIGIWLRCVRWTLRRRLYTFIALIGAAAAAGLLQLTLESIHLRKELPRVVAGLTWWTLWIGSTSLIWKLSTAEMLEFVAIGPSRQVRCPACRYDMRGLDAARCPECGRRFTLDELYAAQSVEPTNAYG